MPRGLSTNPEFLLLAENFKEQFGGLLVNYQKGFLGRAGITLSDDEDVSFFQHIIFLQLISINLGS